MAPGRETCPLLTQHGTFSLGVSSPKSVYYAEYEPFGNEWKSWFLADICANRKENEISLTGFQGLRFE